MNSISPVAYNGPPETVMHGVPADRRRYTKRRVGLGSEPFQIERSARTLRDPRCRSRKFRDLLDPSDPGFEDVTAVDKRRQNDARAARRSKSLT
jgi:hypothetical protein